MSIRKALGAVKDQATIGIARVSGAVKPDLDVAIVRATSHDDAPPDDRHGREVLRLAAGGSQRACVASLARRLARTRDYVVAAKCLALLHRLIAAEGDPHLRGELLRPATSGRRAGEPVLSLLLDFRDEAHAASWEHSAFVRAYALYLDERLRFLVSLLPPPRAVRFADDYSNGVSVDCGGGASSTPAPAATASVGDMDPEGLLVRARQLRQLLDRFLACRPAGAARTSRVVLATLYPLLGDSFRLYDDISAVLAALLDRFFDMEYPECVKAFETYVGAAKQIDSLIAFYAWCDDAGVARSSDFPEVKRVDEKLLETLEQFLRERGRAGRSSPPPQSAHQSAGHAQDEPAEEVDMNGVKALPAPPPVRYSAETTRSVPAKASADQERQPDLVNLRESAAAAHEQENKLALALFSAPPPATLGADGSWVAFPSESDDAPVAISSAWQTPAAEPGKADWELALVETASNLSRQTASLGGGMDPLLLGGMYDQGAVRRQVAAQSASGSASSVALPAPGRGAAAPVLMLPAPDGTVQAIGGDPFAASLAVPPPSYVQMAEMERKQQLLVQEQQMWAQYRQGGMQGQPVGFNGLAAGSVFAANTAVAMPYGMPVAYNHVGWNSHFSSTVHSSSCKLHASRKKPTKLPGGRHGARRQLRSHRRRARLLPRGAARGPRRPSRAPRRRHLPRAPLHALRPPLRAPHRRRQWAHRGAVHDLGSRGAAGRGESAQADTADARGDARQDRLRAQAPPCRRQYLNVRFGARAELPAPRGLLRPCRLPAGHPVGGAGHAGGRLMLGRGFARFVNVRDDHGATPLHLAARQGRPGCLQMLLENGAIVSALTGSYGFPGSTSLHLAARSGNLDCIRKLLAWGADRLQRDSAGRIPYAVALKRNHGACAALLNPSSAEPMVWPSPLKFISELDPEAKALLEAALMEANREREEKILKGTKYSPPSPSPCDADVVDDASSEVSDAELCCICFDQACTIEVQDCGHQMCAPCTLALCCHNKPNPTTLTLPSPACPFCRGSISRLLVARTSSTSDPDPEKAISSPQLYRRRSRRSHNLSDGGSSSFKGLSSAVGSFSRIGRGSSRMVDCDSGSLDKPEHDL